MEKTSAKSPAVVNLADPDPDRALHAYRALAPNYDAHCHRIEGVRAAAIGQLGLRPGETAFDIACGTGSTLVELARLVGPTGRAIGIEQSPEMAAQAVEKIRAAGLEGHATVIVSSIESLSLPERADAMLFCYTQDVLQSPAAIAAIRRHAKPGCRVALAGLCFVPWWWGFAINLFAAWRSRQYLTTYRGLDAPWAMLAACCVDFKIVGRYHAGTSYLARGIL